MTKKEILDFIDIYFPIPSFVEWEPDEWEKEHYYKDLNDKKTYKRYIKQKEKINSEKQKAIDTLTEKKNDIRSKITALDELPCDISNLFYTTIKNMVEDGISIRAKYSEVKASFHQKYKDSFIDKNSYDKYNTPYDYSDQIRKIIRIEYDLESKTNVAKYDQDKYNYIKSNCPYIDNINLIEFKNDADIFYQLEYEARNSFMPMNAIIHGTDKCSTIYSEIKFIFNGNPERCVKDPDWGVGGYFNGVLEGNGIKVSFKSFVAGGYNIQKRHIRFRMTKLKN